MGIIMIKTSKKFYKTKNEQILVVTFLFTMKFLYLAMSFSWISAILLETYMIKIMSASQFSS